MEDKVKSLEYSQGFADGWEKGFNAAMKAVEEEFDKVNKEKGGAT